MSCQGAPNGTLCSSDPLQAERCLGGSCVGTYVSNTGSPANPGTRTQPKSTITDALSIAMALAAVPSVPRPVPVFVGRGNATNPVTFAEDVVLPDNVDLQGGWGHDVAGTWSRNISVNVTRIAPTTSAGVRLSVSGMTRSNTRMSGFTVVGASSFTDTAAITVSNGAQPSLSQLIVIGGSAGVSSGLSAGILILGEPGGLTHPLVADTTSTGGTGARTAGIVLRTSNPRIELVDSTAIGGAQGISYGVACFTACAGSVFLRSSLNGGTTSSGTGLLLIGDSSGTSIQLSTLNGGEGTSPTTGSHYGLHLAGVSTNVSCGGTGPIITSSTIIGSRGPTLSATGIRSEHCPADVRSSTIMGAAPRGGPAATSISEGVGINYNGAGATLTLIDNQIWGAGQTLLGSVTTTSRATGVYGGLGGPGTFQRNVIRSGDCSGSAGGAWGMQLYGTPRVENNVITGGVGPNSVGVVLYPPGGGADAVFVNNHIEAGGSPAAGSASRGLIISSGVGGAFLNNNILAGTSPNRVVVQESSTSGDPRYLINNNLFGAGTLYRNEGNSDLTTIAQVNALTVGPLASGNISGDPLVVGPGDWHLTASSPNRGVGVPAFMGLVAPPTDFDTPADSRPLPLGTNPDIGPDERN